MPKLIIGVPSWQLFTCSKRRVTLCGGIFVSQESEYEWLSSISRHLFAFTSLSVVIVTAAASDAHAEDRRMNVLFITADDLGLQLGCYGETLIETPNLDRLAMRPDNSD